MEEVEGFAERLRRQVEMHEFTVHGEPERMTVSIGGALWPTHGDSFAELKGKANAAEHAAKDDGGNCVRFTK